MWWGPIWILKPRKFRTNSQREDKIINSMFRKHSNSGKSSLKRLLRRRRSKISFVAAITGNLCPGVCIVLVVIVAGEVRTLDEWMCSNISRVDQKTCWATFLFMLLNWQQKPSSKRRICKYQLCWYICLHKALKLFPSRSAVCDIPCLQYWRQISAAFPKARWTYAKKSMQSQKHQVQCDRLLDDASGLLLTLRQIQIPNNSLQAGVDCKGTNCLVSFCCHHTPPPCQSDWQVSIWSFGAKLLPFPVTIWCFFPGEQVELSSAVHVLGSLPVQLPDQTPWHPLQVPAQYAFPLFFFYSDLLDFSLFYRHSLAVNCAQKSFNKRLPQLGDLIQWPFCEHYIRSHHCQIVIIVIIVTIVGLSDFHHCWVVIVRLSSYCQS